MMYDLEFLREMMRDTRLHIGIGTITALGVAKNNSKLRVRVKLLPDGREQIAEMCWGDVGDETGFYSFPEVKNLVILAMVDGEPDESFVIARCSSSDEKIPTFALQGHTILYAKKGKKLYLGSDTKVGIGKLASEQTEPLVLGNVLMSCLTDVLNAFLNATQIGQHPLGPVFLDPGVRTALTDALSKYVTTASTNVASQIGFTERGT